MNIGSNHSALHGLKEPIRNGYWTIPKSVEALTLKDIQDAANKYLNMQNYIKAVLYPEK